MSPFEPQEARRAAARRSSLKQPSGWSFDGLWLTGMEAARWPPPAAPDPFLPRSWQIRRRDARRRSPSSPSAQSRRLFDAAGAERRRNRGERRAFRRRGRGARERVARRGAAARDEPPPGRTSALASASTRHDRRSTGRSMQRLPPAVARRPARGGAKLLELQSACPFRAGAESGCTRARSRNPHRGSPPTERGELVHGVLARLWGVLRDQAALLAQDAMRRSSRLVEAASSRKLSELRRGMRRGSRERLLELEVVLAREAACASCSNSTARARRSRSTRVESPKTVTLGALALRGEARPRRSTARMAASPSSTTRPAATPSAGAWLGDRPRQPQFPLYVQALGRGARRGGGVSAACAPASRPMSGSPATRAAFGGIASFGGPMRRVGMHRGTSCSLAWRERLLGARGGVRRRRCAPGAEPGDRLPPLSPGGAVPDQRIAAARRTRRSIADE